MKQYYYTKTTLFSKPIYLLASQSGLAYVTSLANNELEFLAEVKAELDIMPEQCTENKEQLNCFLEEIKRYEQGHSICYDKLSLDLNGTPFQMQVWNSLLSIPFGETTFYQAIAEKIDKQKAVRAVGRAIGANPLLLFVPCHRVIGKNGTLTGFSEGVELKREWLEHEKLHRR